MSNVLVFAEHQHKKFSKTALVAVTAGKDLAAKSGGQCYAAVLGSGIEALAQELAQYGVAKVFAVEHPSLGRSCRAGASVVSVDGDGDVRRCHFVDDVIGNLYDGSFDASLRAAP